MEDSSVTIGLAAIKFLGTITSGILWLAGIWMLKRFFSHGISIAFAEVMLKSEDQKFIQRIARWFGNSDIILDYLREIRQKVDK